MAAEYCEKSLRILKSNIKKQDSKNNKQAGSQTYTMCVAELWSKATRVLDRYPKSTSINKIQKFTSKHYNDG